MTHRWSVRWGVGAVLALAIGAASARADMSQSTLPHWRAFLSPLPGFSPVLSNDGHAGIVFGARHEVTAFGAESVELPLRPSVDPRHAVPHTFDSTASRFGFFLNLTDITSGQHGRVDFTGYFSGTMTITSANLSAVFTSPEMARITLGNYSYVLHATYLPIGGSSILSGDDLGPEGAPPIPSLPKAGAFIVSVDGVRTTPMPDTPEPSTFMLAAMGLPVAGLVCWRRSRRRRI